MRVLARSMTLRWAFVPIAAGYMVALALVANFAFGAEFFGASQYARPARVDMYGNTLTSAAPVDVQQIANDISEAGGGPPTIAQPRPAETSATEAPMAQAAAAPGTTLVTIHGTTVAVSKTTTPTYTALTRVSTLQIASLLAMIPTNLTFPSHAGAHHRK